MDQGKGLQAPSKNSAVSFRMPPGVMVSAVGIVLPSAVTFDEWKGLGTQITQINGAARWIVADFLNYGEGKFGAAARDFAQTLGLDYQTLANYKYVAGKVPVDRRKEGLTFSHHAEVAALDPEQQALWLSHAGEAGLTRVELRAAIKEAADEKKQRDPEPDEDRARAVDASRPPASPMKTVTPINAGKTPEARRTALQWALIHRASHTYTNAQGKALTVSFEIVETKTETGTAYDIFSDGGTFGRRASFGNALKRVEEYAFECEGGAF